MLTRLFIVVSPYFSQETMAIKKRPVSYHLRAGTRAKLLRCHHCLTLYASTHEMQSHFCSITGAPVFCYCANAFTVRQNWSLIHKSPRRSIWWFASCRDPSTPDSLWVRYHRYFLVNGLLEATITKLCIYSRYFSLIGKMKVWERGVWFFFTVIS